MYPIQRQADVYGIFEPQDKPERTAAAPESEVADLLRGPAIMAGLNARHKEAVATPGFSRPGDGRGILPHNPNAQGIPERKSPTNWDDVWRNTVQSWHDGTMDPRHQQEIMQQAQAEGVKRPDWHINPKRYLGSHTAGNYLRDLAREQHEDWLNHAGQHGYDPDDDAEKEAWLDRTDPYREARRQHFAEMTEQGPGVGAGLTYPAAGVAGTPANAALENGPGGESLTSPEGMVPGGGMSNRGSDQWYAASRHYADGASGPYDVPDNPSRTFYSPDPNSDTAAFGPPSVDKAINNFNEIGNALAPGSPFGGDSGGWESGGGASNPAPGGGGGAMGNPAAGPASTADLAGMYNQTKPGDTPQNLNALPDMPAMMGQPGAAPNGMGDVSQTTLSGSPVTPTPAAMPAPSGSPGMGADSWLPPGGSTSPAAPKVGVNTRGMDPDEHAYATEAPYGPGGEWVGDETGGPSERRHYNPYSGYEPTDLDERRREAVGEDDESGYNWGPAPHPEDIAGPGMDPNFRDGRPLPFGTPTYNPGGGYDDYPHSGAHDDYS